MLQDIPVEEIRTEKVSEDKVESARPVIAPPTAVRPLLWNRRSLRNFVFVIIAIFGALFLSLFTERILRYSELAYLLPDFLNPSHTTTLRRNQLPQEIPTPPPIAPQALRTDLPTQELQPVATPNPWAPYVPAEGLTVVDSEYSPDKKQIALVLGKATDNYGYWITSASSSSKLVLYTLETKEEKVLLERPIVTRTDIMDGPAYLYDIRAVTWAPSRNSLIFSAHDKIQEISLQNSEIRTHFTASREDDWEEMFGFFELEYWPEANILTYSRLYYEHTVAYAIQLDQAENTRAARIGSSFTEGKTLQNVWGNTIVVSEMCETNLPETPLKDVCSKLSLKTFPTLDEIAAIKFERTSDNVNFTRSGDKILATYGYLDGSITLNQGLDHRGQVVVFWEHDRRDNQLGARDRHWFLKMVTRDQQVREIARYEITSDTQRVYWEQLDADTVVVRVLDATNTNALPTLLSEQTYSLK